jgi:hypothetical protein
MTVDFNLSRFQKGFPEALFPPNAVCRAIFTNIESILAIN